MDESSPFRKKWLYITAWLAILLIIYGWQIARMGGVLPNLPGIIFDLLCIFPVFLILWMAFFAQFVLPVHTFEDRQKIFSRLLADLFGKHGPALFIENGEVKEHSGERLKKGPGVIWLDSASAAVTRTPTKIKQTLGPGVHFIEKGEFIAGTVDLHIQSQTIGPKENDKPFEEKKEGQTDEEFNQIQDRRKQVSALTRDGIEVIPNISVTFRVNTGFPAEGKPGSRFGYRTGITEKDKKNEKEDKEAIRKAILGEGINPNVAPDSPRRRVKWNELPAALAVDVWREYVAKFTLDELFKAEQIIPPPPPQLPQPTEEEIDLLSQPLRVGSRQNNLQDSLASMLHEINLTMRKLIKWLEGEKEDKTPTPPVPQPAPSNSYQKKEPEKKTALQVINEMVNARLTRPYVDFLDNHGKREYPDVFGHPNVQVPSREYKLLEERGLIVLNVSVNNFHLNPLVDQELIKQWTANWLGNAKAEGDQIDRMQDAISTSARERVLTAYAEALSAEIKSLTEKGTPNIKSALKSLLMRSRALIRSGELGEHLRRRLSTELQDIEGIIKWVEANG
jgi:hypothetical protein